MKVKQVLIILICLSTIGVKSQNLELQQLQSIIDQKATVFADSLTKTGWVLRPELSGKQGDQLYQTFSFGNLTKEKAKALAWLRIHADHDTINQLYYQSPGIAQFRKVVAQIKEAGAEKKDVQSIEEQSISAYYISSDYIFQTISGNNSFTVMVMTNKQ